MNPCPRLAASSADCLRSTPHLFARSERIEFELIIPPSSPRRPFLFRRQVDRYSRPTRLFSRSSFSLAYGIRRAEATFESRVRRPACPPPGQLPAPSRDTLGRLANRARRRQVSRLTVRIPVSERMYSLARSVDDINADGDRSPGARDGSGAVLATGGSASRWITPWRRNDRDAGIVRATVDSVLASLGSDRSD